MNHVTERVPMPSGAPLPTRHSVVVVGGGQAGLAATACLQRRGIQPLVLEKHQIGYAWEQQRWDSFCLVTPNWQCRLPDFPYDGDDPDGFMGRGDIVAYVRRFASSIAADVREGVSVERLSCRAGRYSLRTTAGEIEAGAGDRGHRWVPQTEAPS